MLWNVVLAVIIVVALAFACLMLIPAKRKGGATIEIKASAEQILDILQDAENQPTWRKDIRSVEILGDGWTEISNRNVRTRFRWVSVAAQRAELAFESNAGYSGNWVANLVRTENGTRMEVVEEVTVPNPVSRLITRVFFDPDAFSQSYLDQLKRKAEQ
jgi:uncharacterized membrane protein